MDIGSLTAVQELVKHHHLTSGEKKRKKIEPEKEAPPSLFFKEAEVKDATILAQKEQERLQKAQAALAYEAPTRSQKLDVVNRRIDAGFYEKREVLEAVAGKLLLLFREEKGGHG